MSLESWWKNLAKERTKRVQSRTQRTLARQEAKARVAEAKHGRKAHVVADTGEVIVEEPKAGVSWYLPAAMGAALLWGLSSKKE